LLIPTIAAPAKLVIKTLHWPKNGRNVCGKGEKELRPANEFYGQRRPNKAPPKASAVIVELSHPPVSVNKVAA